MTNDQLRAMEALTERLPPGDWDYSPDGHGFGGDVIEGESHFVCKTAAGHEEYGPFIAAARTFVPEAIAEIRRRRKGQAGD